MSNRFYNLFLTSGAFTVELFARSGLAANYSLALPNTAPTDGQYLRYNNTNTALEWGIPAVGGGGTVSSVGLTLPSFLTVSGSPVTSAGTLAATLASQTKNTLLIAPPTADGAPTFRTLVDADLPSGISANKISGALAKANIPNGTTASTFQLNGSTGCTLATDAGGALIVNGADGTSRADIYGKNLFLTGKVETELSNNVNLGDSTITLLADFTTGTPSTDAGLVIRRGSSTNFELKFNETSDKWQVGASDNLRDVTREFSQTFTNADITSGNLVVTHGLRCTTNDPNVIVKTNLGRDVRIGTTYTSSDVVTLDFSRAGTLTGSWQVSVYG